MEKEKQAKQMPDSKDVEENKGITILSYIGILVLIPLLAKKESAFAQYHAKQGLIVLIMGVISSILTPVFGLGLLLWLITIIFSIIGIVNVVKGEMKPLPLIGEWAQKMNF